MDIDSNIQFYRSDINPVARYASFDYCFNYFQQFKETNTVATLASREHIQESCLQLGFYLASWGMLRGSTVLIQKSVKYLEHLIDGIAQFDSRIWHIDIDRYDDTTIEVLFACRSMIQTQLLRHALPTDSTPSDTLITKIMLGVFGNVPAFDAYFKRGFKMYNFNTRALYGIADFYQHNRIIIDKHDIKTLDFLTGKSTQRSYTKAKLVDMVGFIEGYNA